MFRRFAQALSQAARIVSLIATVLLAVLPAVLDELDSLVPMV